VKKPGQVPEDMLQPIMSVEVIPVMHWYGIKLKHHPKDDIDVKIMDYSIQYGPFLPLHLINNYRLTFCRVKVSFTYFKVSFTYFKV
jgi:hypothetical protein